MEKAVHVAGISGSLRNQSYNTMLLNSLEALMPEGVLFETISIASLPLYNGDDDLPIARERPAAVNAFRYALAKADALIIVSPEYNYSVPGGLKNAIDWASRGEDSPIRKKPVALMGATTGMWGTVRMQLAFEPIFLTLDMQPVKPEVLISQAAAKFDGGGKLVDENTLKLISRQLVALKDLAIKKHTEQAPSFQPLK